MLAFVPPSEVFIFFAMEGPRHQNGVGQEYRVQQRGRGNEATMRRKKTGNSPSHGC